MKSKKQPKTKLIRLPIRTTDILSSMRTNPAICPSNTRPSYNAVISYLIEYRRKSEYDIST